MINYGVFFVDFSYTVCPEILYFPAYIPFVVVAVADYVVAVAVVSDVDVGAVVVAAADGE